MKYILLSFCLLTGSFIPLEHNNDNIEEMWKEVYALESKGLPQSALEIVDKIKALAISTNEHAHLIQSIIYKQKLKSQFEDNDPAEYISEFESSLEELSHPETRSILQSFIGELYHQYGMANIGRANDRTELPDDKNSIQFLSLDEIQRRSIEYFLSSLSIRSEIPIQEYSQLWERSNYDLKITAETLEEFLVFRALAHFINDQSFVTQAKDPFRIDDSNYLASKNVFRNLILHTDDQKSYKHKSLELFQRALLLTETKPELNTLIDLKRIEYVYQHYKNDDKEELYVTALENIINQQPVNPSIELAYGKMVDFYLRRGELYRNNYDDEFKEDFKKAYAWIQKAKLTFSDGKYEDLIRNQKLRLNSKFVNITLESVIPANNDFLSYIQYRNTDKVYFRLYRLSQKEWEKYTSIRQTEEKLNYLKKRDIHREWERALKGKEDFNYHATELNIEGLDYGRYVLQSSLFPSFKYLKGNHLDLNTFTVSDMSYVHNSMESYTEGYVLNRISGEPISDVKIEAYSQQYNYTLRRNQYVKIADYKTGEDGYFIFKEDEKNFNLVLEKGDDLLDTRQGHYNRTYRNRNNTSQVHLFTDRAIYRPGQIIYFKGLTTLNNNAGIPEILENKKVTISLKDANWQEVNSKTFTTNLYGTFDGYFNIPEGLLNGNMTLEAKVINGYGSQSVKVEEYKRPKIKIDYLPFDEPYAQGDTVSLAGFVESFSGVRSQGAKVKYQIIQESYWPWWCGYYRRYPANVNRVIANGEVESGEDGIFEIVFPTDDKEESYYSYRIICDVTDITGETISKTKTLRLSKSALKLSQLYIVDGFEGEVSDFAIVVTDAEDNPVETSVAVKISQLQHNNNLYQKRLWGKTDLLTLEEKEYSNRFPLHKYDHLDTPESWQVKSVISDKKYKSSIDKLELSKLKSGVYKIDFVIVDSKGRSQDITQYVQISDKKKRALPTKHLWVSTNAISYEPGTVAEININAPFDDYLVFYRLGHNRNTLQKAWLDDKTKSFEIEITESMRGGVGIEVLLVKDNRLYRQEVSMNVPWSNKSLNVKYETFRDKLKPGELTDYSISFEWPGSLKKELEVLASMYDASLDAMVAHQWIKQFYPNYGFYGSWSGAGFRTITGRMYYENIHSTYRTNIQGFEPRLNRFGFYLPSRFAGGDMVMASMEGIPRKAQMRNQDELSMEEDVEMEPPRTAEPPPSPEEESSSSNVRENLNETVFFYPDLKTEDGNVTISFTMNEALTQWNFMLFAHNEDLQYVFDNREVVTQKELMIEPLMPRFIRQGDTMVLSARVSNLSDQFLNVNASLSLEDALDQSNLNERFGVESENPEMELKPGSSKLVEWTIAVPEDFKSMLSVVVRANSDKYSDGERNLLPVLTNKKLITEALPFFVHGESSKEFKFNALQKAELSNTLEHVGLTVEVTSDPRWLVLKSLPVIMDVKHNSADKWMDAYYAMALADDLIRSNESIHRALQNWKGDDLVSELQKKGVFKELSLESTPWVRAAISESQNMQSLKVLLDKNVVDNKLSSFALQIENAQTSNGGFSWFPGGRDNWYITQYMMEVVGRMRTLELDIPERVNVDAAIKYLDKRLLEYYKDISKDDFRVPSQRVIHYMFVRSLFPEIMVANNVMPALKYFKTGLRENWVKLSSHNQALLGQAFRNWSEIEIAQDILNSLQERIVRDPEIGYYWNDQAGYYVFNNNLEAHSHMIEFFESMKVEKDEIDMLKLWLLRHKQVNEWSTTRSTAAAVYVFMKSMIDGSQSHVPLEIILPQNDESITMVDGSKSTGYSKHEFGTDIQFKNHIDWKVQNKNAHPAWGAIFWQYTELLNEIQSEEDNPLVIKKELFKVGMKDNGEVLIPLDDGQAYQQGDKIRTRITLECDRPMSFIHLSDMRASGAEPLFSLSQYKYQDGLSYYQSIKDEATHFYFDNVAKGNYVFEYEVVATQKGTYSNGIATIQSFYAPEFGSHSEGEQIRIE